MLRRADGARRQEGIETPVKGEIDYKKVEDDFYRKCQGICASCGGGTRSSARGARRFGPPGLAQRERMTAASTLSLALSRTEHGVDLLDGHMPVSPSQACADVLQQPRQRPGTSTAAATFAANGRALQPLPC